MIDDDKLFDTRATRPMPKPPQELLDHEQQRLALTARDPSVILERRELRAALEGALDEICDRAGAKAERNRAILERLWLDEVNPSAVGREFGLTRKRVETIEAAAQQRLIPLQHRFHDYKDNLPELVVVARESLAVARAEQYRARRDRTPS
jgi:DNA-directed RNA polymerase sigma subunit (sigma70/sigma32)